jgi:hypothetical protein
MTDEVYLLLWGLAGVAVALTCAPMLLALLGLTRCRCTCAPDPDALEPTGDDDAYAAIFAQLQALGLRPAGTQRVTAWFFAFHWVKSFDLRMFATPRGDCFAAVYRLVDGEPWRVTYSTGFTDGALVQSGSTLEDLKVQEEDYLRWGFVTADLAELLGLHRELVGRFAEAGGRAVAPLSLAEVCELEERYSERGARKDKATPLAALGTTLALLGVVPLSLGFGLGFDHWSVPLAFLGGAVRQVLLLPGLIRQSMREQRAQDAAASRPR